MIRAALILALVPMSGCLLPFFWGTCGGGECGEPEPVHDGSYVATDVGVPGMTEAIVDLDDDTLMVTWVDEQGRIWEAEYAVVSRFPEERRGRGRD